MNQNSGPVTCRWPLVAGHSRLLSLGIAAKNIRDADVHIFAVVCVADKLRGFFFGFCLPAIVRL